MQAPSNTGSLYYNYKKHFSIVLLAVADAQYKFTVVDIGAYGQQSDGSVFAHSNLGRMMMEGRLNLPPNQPLQGQGQAIPFVFVGDEATPYAICPWLGLVPPALHTTGFDYCTYPPCSAYNVLSRILHC